MRKSSNAINVDHAEQIAAQALGYLAQNGELLSRFMGLTGLTVETLRQDAGKHHVLASVLDHILGDESLLLAFAATAAIEPGLVASARARLSKEGDVYRST